MTNLFALCILLVIIIEDTPYFELLALSITSSNVFHGFKIDNTGPKISFYAKNESSGTL